MSKLHRSLASAGLLITVAGLCVGGCSDDSTSGPDGTGGTDIPTGCMPSEDDWAPTASCGIFVSSSMGQAAAAGTPEAPVDSIQAAVDLAPLASELGIALSFFAILFDFVQAHFLLP